MSRRFLACLFLWFSQPAAHAHPNLQNSMWVQFEPKFVRVAVNVSVKEISAAQGVALGGNGAADAHSPQQAAEDYQQPAIIPTGWVSASSVEEQASFCGAYYLIVAIHHQHLFRRCGGCAFPVFTCS